MPNLYSCDDFHDFDPVYGDISYFPSIASDPRLTLAFVLSLLPALLPYWVGSEEAIMWYALHRVIRKFGLDQGILKELSSLAIRYHDVDLSHF